MTAVQPSHVSILSILNSVKGLVKPPSVHIDNTVFRLHYKWTTLMLIVWCLLVTTKQYIGEPIHCIVDWGVTLTKARETFTKAMESYCWIRSTFTVPSRALGKKIGVQIPHPGVITPQEGDQLKYHQYYQWVAFTLFFQAMLFYFPHYLWRAWEGEKCKMLVQDLKSPVMSDKKRNEQTNIIADNFVASLHYQNIYFFRFFFCEMLNFFNVVAQIFFTDLFLGYEFTTYGCQVVKYVLNMDQEDRTDPMALVFPTVTKCTFNNYGASGTVQRIDALCVLPINILNQKIYVVLWFWFIGLAGVTGLALLFRVAMQLRWSSQLRQCLMVSTTLASREDVAVVEPKCRPGDWFVLCLIGDGRNMDPTAFKELIGVLAQRFDGKCRLA